MAIRDSALLNEQLRASGERLPGPVYYHVLKWIHQCLEPVNYVEIGVHRGFSMVQAVPDTPCVIGVDPVPSIDENLERTIEKLLPAAKIYELTSDEFFARYDLSELLGGPVALAFIDGLHLFEQALRDFVNMEKHADDGTVMLVHDCIPLDAVTAGRERTTDFYCGDVWKAALALRRRRPELEMVTVRTAPTGLCMVRGLDSRNRSLGEELPEIEATYRDLDFEYYLAHREEMPEEIPNDREAVRAWLRQSRELQAGSRARAASGAGSPRPRPARPDGGSRAAPPGSPSD